MMRYSENPNISYWKKKILSLNIPSLTNDNVIIGFNLSPEQRENMKKYDVIVKIIEETYEQEMGHEDIQQSAKKTKYSTPVRREVAILVQSYKESVVVENEYGELMFRTIIKRMSIKILEPGIPIFKIREPISSMIFVLEGRIIVYKSLIQSPLNINNDEHKINYNDQYIHLNSNSIEKIIYCWYKKYNSTFIF